MVCPDTLWCITKLYTLKSLWNSSPKNKNMLKIYSPSCLLKMSGWVFFFMRTNLENIAFSNLLSNGCSAVNGCRQNESPNSWWKHHNNPHHSSPSINILGSQIRVHNIWSLLISLLNQARWRFHWRKCYVWTRILSGSNGLKLKHINDVFVYYKNSSFSLHKMLIDGLEWCWLVVEYYIAVWTLILTAPIHCRGSIGEQVM